MSVFKYSKYKILIDPKSHKTQGLSVGDVVRRQYVDASGAIYSLMLVLETGVDVITSASGEQNQSHYFVGALLEGDEPANGQLLDFVRTTNLFNLERSGALYLTASDSASPYMDVIDGMSVDKSMCFPYMGGGSPSVADPTKYAIQGANYVTTAYSATKTDASRVFRATRNSVANTDNAFIGLKQSLSATLSNPQRVVVSYKIRGSKATSSIPVSFGYTSWGNMDGVDSTSVSTSWAYKVHIITIDYPAENPRSLYIDLRNILTKENDWCEIADLNIVLLSDIANFNNASKARVGKLSGIVDPIFGVMDGYGAYFQNLFATKNVNVSGTLTAGDENGSASTFYVGRIHKNCFINSLSPKFSTDKHEEDATAFNPAGVGKVFQLHTGTSIMSAQTREWLNSKIGRKYSLSFWMRSEDLEPISVSLAGRTAEEVSPTVAGEWEKIHITTILTNPKDVSLSLSITVNGASVLFTAPQLEAGGRVSLYQPTDDVLRDTDEYGAWFNKGGIGGTIQNPLLKLNEDGSISSANGSFVINSDGSGYFANGAIKWGDKGVEFGEEVTLAWREQTDAQINNISVGSRNYILGTAKSKTFTGNATANQTVWAYNMSPDKEDLGDQICTFSFDWVAEGDSISGSFLFHNRVSPWGQMSLGVRISADNKSGRYTRTWRTTSDNMATMAQLGIRMDNVPSGTTITVSNMSLVLGNKTVGWSEAPEDINSRISSAQSTADSSVTALGGASFPKLTKIDSTGVYTGTLTATQVNAVEINASSIKTGTLNADRIAANSINGDKIIAGSITASKINTSSLQSALITTSYIQGLSLNFTKGKIGAWTIDSEGIYNGKTKLTAAGAIYQTGQAWCFRSDGSGYLANKNIEWDTNGNVTFSDSVKLSWTSYTDQKVEDINIGGRNLFLNSERERSVGGNGSDTYEKITFTDLSVKLEAGQQYTFSCESDGVWGVASGSDTVQAYICKDKLYTTGQYFGINSSPTTFAVTVSGTYWLRIDSNKGSVAHSFWKFQIEKGNKATDWSPAPEDVESRIAVAQVGVNGITTALGGSSFPKLTKIDSTGVYTGTLTANQVNAVGINASSIKTGTLSADRIAAGSLNGNKITAGTISADRITAGSITSTQINVASLQASLVTVDHIQGLTISFSKGKIGSWVINGSDITNGTVMLAGNGTIWHTGSKWRMGYDGAGYLASGNISWDASGNVTFADSVKLSWTSYTDTAVGNIDIGGKNLIESGDFSRGLSAFWFNYMGSSSLVTDSRFGTVAKVIKTSTAQNGGIHTSTHVAKMIDGGSYVASVWMKADSPIDVMFTQESGKSINVQVDTSWKRFVLKFKWTRGTYNALLVRSKSDVYFYVANAQVESGNTVTDWSPAPEDVESRIAVAQVGVNGITTALGGSSFPKLTKIDSTGIYTGTLTATQVNAVEINASSIKAGTLSVDRLAAGSITADKVNVSSLQSSLITTSFIQGLSLSFTKGKIGSWVIESDNIRTNTVIGTAGNIPIQLRGSSTGSGSWYNGSYKPYGLSMLWYQNQNAGHFVFGRIAGSGTTVKDGYIGIQMMSWDSHEYFCLSANYQKSGSKEIYNRIAGWAFDHQAISKGNISLGADGTIKHASAWALNNDGSGRLAKGDISWDTSGNVTINANVKISGSAIAKAITTDSLQVGSNFSVAKDGTLTAVNGIFSGTISGVSGTFRSLKAVNDSGGEEAEITFSSSGGLWFRGDMHHQGTYQGRSQRFYSADIWCRGTFGHSSKSVLIVYGAYGYVYTDSSSSGSRVSFSTVTSGVYSIPLYSPTEATTGLPIDMVLIKTTSSYTFTFPEYKYKTVDVMNIVDKNNNVYVYTNGKTHQMGGGVCLRMMNVGASNMNPTVSTSSYGAGWCIIGRYDNDWS